MDTRQINWRRTSLTILVLAAVAFAPFVVARARHENWNLGDIERRMPWFDPAAGVAGEITTDAAAVAGCASAPTFDVRADDGGALLQVGGPLSLEQANVRLAELDVPLTLGLHPREDVEERPALVSISHGGGEPAVARALEQIDVAAGVTANPIAVPAAGGPAGLVIACPVSDAGQ